MAKIFLVGIFTLQAFCYSSCEEMKASEPVAFWPPDLIPHPHLPAPPKKDDDMA